MSMTHWCIALQGDKHLSMQCNVAHHWQEFLHYATYLGNRSTVHVDFSAKFNENQLI